MCPLKHPLQSLELAAVERGPVPALLPLLLLLRVHLLIYREEEGPSAGTFQASAERTTGRAVAD